MNFVVCYTGVGGGNGRDESLVLRIPAMVETGYTVEQGALQLKSWKLFFRCLSR